MTLLDSPSRPLPPGFTQARGGRHAMATRTELSEGAAGGRLSALALRFVLHWGEMATRWGVNRTVAQIQALLYFHGRTFHAEELADLLEVARSVDSTSL